MKLGSDVLISEKKDLLSGKRIGVLSHSASITSNGKHIVDELLSMDCEVAALFGPEHGINGLAQDLEPVKDSKSKNLHVYSLYGETFASLSPTKEMLDNIDLLVVDLQDIGSRYYTYVNTMAFCLRACSALKKEVVVCDRPNPINGIVVEGNSVEEEFRSYVGMYPIPNRHGLTIGELAKYFIKKDLLNPDLIHISQMDGWNREMFFDETGIKWMAPSPNMRSISAAFLYPGMCLLEGTNISEGRGTKTPFEVCGAPWVDGKMVADRMQSLKLPGICFASTVFTPTSRKFSGEKCKGLTFTIIDRRSFKPYLTGLALIYTIALMYPKKFAWNRDTYEFVSDIPAIDLLTGNSEFRRIVRKKVSFEKLTQFASINNEQYHIDTRDCRLY